MFFFIFFFNRVLKCNVTAIQPLVGQSLTQWPDLVKVPTHILHCTSVCIYPIDNANLLQTEETKIIRETVPFADLRYMGKKTVSVHTIFCCHKGLTCDIKSLYTSWGTLEVSSVLRLKSACYSMFCPLALNEWRRPFQLNKICSSTVGCKVDSEHVD